MGSLTVRGRAAVVLAFVLSAALATTAAVALVKTGGSDRSPGRTLPRVSPSLVTGATATPSASATPDETTAPTTAPSGSATPSASASPQPSSSAVAGGSASPRPQSGQGPTYLSAKADLLPVSQSAFRLVVRATDGDDDVTLSQVRWGDGATASSASGSPCSAPAGGDCQVFSLQHDYRQLSADRTYAITVLVSAGRERVALTLHATVPAKAPVPSATPSPTPTSTPSPSPSPTSSP
jgi:hypothetical protein